MLTVLRNKVVYTSALSQAIGEAIAQQRLAYNHAVDYMLDHPSVSKYDLYKELTEQRIDKERWNGKLQIHRAGLTRGRDAVRAYDKAIAQTIKKEQKGKRITQNPSVQRLYKTRKQKRLALVIDDCTTLKVLNQHTIRVAGLTLKLASPIEPTTDIRAIQILERKSSCRLGRNSSLAKRSYNVNFVISIPDPESKDPDDSIIGLDTGITNRLADNELCFYDTPELYTDKIELLQERQKRLKHRGRQWRKCQKLINKERKRNRNITRNWEQHTARDIAQEYSTVAVEKLQHRNLRASARRTLEQSGKQVAQKRGLNKVWANVRPGILHATLARQCEKAGAKFVEVNASYTSQTCPVCEHRAKENRKSQAEFLCVNCGFTLHADSIGSINIRRKYTQERGMGMSSLDDSLRVLRTLWHGLELSRTTQVHAVQTEIKQEYPLG